MLFVIACDLNGVADYTLPLFAMLTLRIDTGDSLRLTIRVSKLPVICLPTWLAYGYHMMHWKIVLLSPSSLVKFGVQPI